MHTDSKGIYIHVPFCAKKCPYCDFYSCKYSKLKSEAYIDAVLRNIEIYKENNYSADTIYFGGGTPSLLSGQQINDIIQKCHETFDVSNDCEITVECNPLTMSIERMTDYYNAGVNRISAGTQSFDDAELKFLGRKHNSEQAIKAIENAYSAGFKNISCDIMIAFPNERKSILKKNIDIISNLPVTHVSSYMLKIEEGTEFYLNDNLKMSMPDDDTSADIYLETVSLLKENGFEQYEISNFAKSGFQSVHNNKYWECKEYIGIGPSAHSFLNGKRFYSESNLDKFINNKYQSQIITDDNAGDIEEKIMLALRLKKGISLREYSIKNIKIVENLQKAGLIKKDADRIYLTPNGFLVSNAVICELIDAL